MKTDTMSNQRVMYPISSVPNLKVEPKEKHESKAIVWCEDKKAVYLNFSDEERNIIESAPIEKIKNENEKLHQKEFELSSRESSYIKWEIRTFKKEEAESNNKNIDKEFDNDIMENDTNKQKFNDVNEITAQDLKYSHEIFFKSENIEYEESHIKQEEDNEDLLIEKKYYEGNTKHEEFQKSASAEVTRDKKENLDKRNIDEFDSDIKIVMECAVKKETNTENATAEESEVLSVDRNYDGKNRFQLETIQQQEVDIKSKEDKKKKRSKKARKPENQVVLHQCSECPYNTNYKWNLKLHSIKHKKRDEIDLYSCPKCSYETCRKETVKRHAGVRNNLMLKCPKCYESLTRTSLKIHQIKRKTFELHSCPLCSYNTPNKHFLKKHCRRSHSYDPSNPKQMETFKCTECSYENGCKYTIEKHRLIHDRSSWLQCPDCAYRTPRKNSLKNHQLRHQGENAEGWYRCLECSYKTAHKAKLRIHIITHKTADEIQGFECSRCNYKTMIKSNLTKHQLIHKEAKEVEWFCCYECSFKTKHKSSLAKHVSKHKKVKRQR